MTLGEVIQIGLIQREAMWAMPAVHPRSSHHQPQSQPHHISLKPRMKIKGGGKEGGKGDSKGGSKGDSKGDRPGHAKKMVAKFRDGKQLCMAYNNGRCNDSQCNKGYHRCAGVDWQGKVCGAPRPAILCTNPRAPKR